MQNNQTEKKPDKKVLLLSYCFPPGAQSEASVAAKAMGGLKDIGFDVTVVAADAVAHGVRPEYSLLPYVEDRFSKITYLRPANPLAYPVAFGLLAKWLPFLYNLPDRYRLTNSAVWKFVEGLPLQDFSALITRSQSHAIHLVGLKIKRKFPALRWIAHLSDPWVDNPYLQYDRLTSRWNARDEKNVIMAADHIVVTSSETRDLIFEKYPPEWTRKVSVIPHPFDLSLYPQISPSSNLERRLRISHLGHFYGQRSPLPFLRALQILSKTHPETLQNLKFDFYGTLKDRRKPLAIVKDLPENLCTFHPPVEYLSSLRIMKESDGLLLIDAPAEISVFLPSKLIDYLGAERPIFGITPPGPARSILSKIGAFSADPDQPEQIAERLRSFIVSLKSNTMKMGVASSDFREQFSVESISRQVAELLV